MKKNLALLATAGLVPTLGLSACGKNEQSAGGEEAEATSSASTSDDAKIAIATSLEEIGTLDDLVAAAEKEGALNLIALPHNWSNWGEVIEAFKTKYPKITVNEANPGASSKEEIDAIKTNAGTDKAPDVVDVSGGVAAESTAPFFAYVILVLPFAYRALDNGFSTINVATLAEAARSLGASWPTVMFRVIIPNMWPAIGSAAFISMAVVLGEFTMASLLNRVNLQVAVFMLGQDDSMTATAIALLAMVFGIVVLAAIDLISNYLKGRRS